jgi:serine/threonine-protein kinase
MGTVYKAEHALLGKIAAVKVLHPELRGNEEVVNRFFNEAKATTFIKHPGIVEIFDFGYLPSGDGYIVMEFLEGESLAHALENRARLNEGEAAMILRGVCSALAAAHAKGIVHRDLKPDNIFLCPDPDSPTGERPKLLDFGIAKLSDRSLSGGTATKTGAVMGTPTYMSPEQCRGTGAVDLRSDLYSLGCILYEMVCGRPPFEAEGAGELIGAHLFMQPEPPRKHTPELSEAAERLILQLLAKKPDERPQTARELGQRLGKLAEGQGWITNTNPTASPLSSVMTLSDSAPIAARTTSPSSTPGVPPNFDPIARTMPSDANLARLAAASAPPTPTPKPTTLSLAASQSVIQNPRSRKGLWLGIGGGVAAAVTVTVVLVSRGGGDHPASSPHNGGSETSAATAATAPRPPPVTAVPRAPAVATPSPTAPSPPATTPSPAVAVTPPTPALPAEVRATPSPAEPVAVTAPARVPPRDHAAPARTPHGAAAAVSSKSRPTAPSSSSSSSHPASSAGAGSGSGSGSGKILIETDL